jgi:hypothetical protein
MARVPCSIPRPWRPDQDQLGKLPPLNLFT